MAKAQAVAAGPRATLARRLPPALVRTQLTQLEVAIGGRDGLVAALAHAPKSRDLEYVLGLLGDPEQAATPIADLCASGGITAGELLEAYRSGEIARAQVLATQQIGAALPGVVADTMKRAAPYQITCPACQGTAQVIPPRPSRHRGEWNPAPVPCPDCLATGEVTIQGDLEHKKLALEIGHLTAKSGGGVSVAVHNQVGVLVGVAGGALERLQTATDQILYGQDAPILDGSVVKEVVPDAVTPSGSSVAPAVVCDGATEASASLDTDWRGDIAP